MANKAPEPAAVPGAAAAPSDFIRDIVAAHVAEKKLPQLRHRPRVRRHLQPAHGRHQPDERVVFYFHTWSVSNPMGLTVFNPPTQADVQALADKLDGRINTLNA